jgi:purine-nucleoside phosphorylase
MEKTKTLQKIREAVESIQTKSGWGPLKRKPEIGIVLGSGLGAIADQMTESTKIAYSEIPHFHGTAVEGHAGQLILGFMSGVPTVLLQGRFHFYEGYSMEDVVLATRTLCALGIHTLILTNAAGGINAQLSPGDLMLIDDHLNLMGDNPLRGPNVSELGPRFPDLTEAYNYECLAVLQSTLKELEIPYQQGVYAGLLGPTYETPAEVRMLRTLGADAVGMSTVPECIAANHMGVRVAGISCITNLAAGLSPHKLSHQEVMAVSQQGSQKISRLITSALPKLAHRK